MIKQNELEKIEYASLLYTYEELLDLEIKKGCDSDFLKIIMNTEKKLTKLQLTKAIKEAEILKHKFKIRRLWLNDNLMSKINELNENNPCK
jgi:hypothetical protein